MMDASDGSVRTTKYSSSTGTSGGNLDDLVRLGERIAHEIDTSDLLGRWMSHYLADLLSQYEASEGERQNAIGEKCAELVVQLWSHRAALPIDPRPLAGFDPVYRALERLDPESDGNFFGMSRIDAVPVSDRQAAVLADLAAALEDRARLVIHVLMREAIEAATAREAAWIPMATQAVSEAEGDFRLSRLMRMVERKTDGSAAEDAPVSEAQRVVREMIETLQVIDSALEPET